MGDNDFKLGEHEASIRTLLENDVQILARLAGIEATLAERRGERRAAFWLAGTLGGAIGTALTVSVKLVEGYLKR